MVFPCEGSRRIRTKKELLNSVTCFCDVYTGETHRTSPLKEYKTILHHEEFLNTPPTKTSKNRGELDLLGVPEEEKTQREKDL